MKRLFALLLALAMVLALGACSGSGSGTGAAKLEDLVGSWQSTFPLDEEEAEELLDYFGFTEEERDIIDHDVFQLAQIFTVGADKTYSFAIDGERSRSMIRQSFNSILGQVYDHLGELEDTYGEGIAEEFADLAEFKEYYASIYDLESYDAFLDEVVGDFLDYYSLDTPIVLESGTFTIKGDEFEMTEEGETDPENLGYSLSGNTLLLTYSDGEELYTRLAQ